MVDKSSKSVNPKQTDPNNPSTVGNKGNVGGVPEAFQSQEPSPETATNPNTGPTNQPDAVEKNTAKVEETNPQTGTTTVTKNTGGKPPIRSISFKSKFLELKITDPNILDEVNTPDKYATNLPFNALWISVNKQGGRYYIMTQDRKEVDREIVSGIHRNETGSLEFFETDRTAGQ